MVKTGRKVKNKRGVPAKRNASAAMKGMGGSCAGVKYPCTYSCKKCFFESVYH